MTATTAALSPAMQAAIQELGQNAAVRALIDLALAEDIGRGDITTLATVAAEATATAEIVQKAPGVVCGLPVVALVFAALDPQVTVTPLVDEGSPDERRAVVRLAGPARSILSGERTALNFLQRLSGIATASHRAAALVAGTGATVLDTRKTTPGHRVLEKYAVRAGGCRNHRAGLDDGILIKENHIRAAGGIARAVERCRQGVPLLTKIEVEVTDFDELRQAIDAGADCILLDNMSPEQMRQAAEVTAGRAQLEASGGITSENLIEVASSGVDFISSGALTHSVKALDISLLIEL
jgi:nicotinate-nucleotide pyrophosphorylase (carboxylating)